jgi:hypothetical protein
MAEASTLAAEGNGLQYSKAALTRGEVVGYVRKDSAKSSSTDTFAEGRLTHLHSLGQLTCFTFEETSSTFMLGSKTKLSTVAIGVHKFTTHMGAYVDFGAGAEEAHMFVKRKRVCVPSTMMRETFINKMVSAIAVLTCPIFVVPPNSQTLRLTRC